MLAPALLIRLWSRNSFFTCIFVKSSEDFMRSLSDILQDLRSSTFIILFYVRHWHIYLKLVDEKWLSGTISVSMPLLSIKEFHINPQSLPNPKHFFILNFFKDQFLLRKAES